MRRKEKNCVCVCVRCGVCVRVWCACMCGVCVCVCVCCIHTYSPESFNLWKDRLPILSFFQSLLIRMVSTLLVVLPEFDMTVQHSLLHYPLLGRRNTLHLVDTTPPTEQTNILNLISRRSTIHSTDKTPFTHTVKCL